MEQITQYFNILSISEWMMAFVVVVLAMSLFSLKRERKQQQDQQLTMQSLQRDLRALANAAVGVGGRVLEIERHQRKRPSVASIPKENEQTKANFQQPPLAPVEYYNSSSQPYEQAIRMAQTGASTDDIVHLCGLSKSEADLVSMMHRLDKVS